MKHLALLTSLLILSNLLYAQTNTFPSAGAVGIGTTTPASSALLDVNSSTKGLLIPRMTSDQKNAIISPVAGLLVYQTNNKPGFYYYTGNSWASLANTRLSNLATTTIAAGALQPGIDSVYDIGAAAFAWRDGYYKGKLNVGSVISSTALDIKGKLKMADGSQGLGKVLTSDANGVASWQTLIGAPWTANGPSSVNGNFSVNGDLAVYGKIRSYSADSLTGPAFVNGSLSVNGDITVNGKVTSHSTGPDSLHGPAYVLGSLFVNGFGGYNGNLNVNGAIKAGGPDTLVGSTFIVGDISIVGSAYKPGGGSWAAPSDARLKDHVQKFTDGMDVIMKINPVKYHYNKSSGFDTKPEYIGVIAQDMQAVSPYMVTSFTKGGTSQQYLQVDNSSITYVLVNALKEMKKKDDAKDSIIDVQNKRIIAVEQKLAFVLQKLDDMQNSNAAKAKPGIDFPGGGLKDESILEQNAPNPFNQSTVIKYHLPAGTHSCVMIITNESGAAIKQVPLSSTVTNGQITLPAGSLSQGTYFYTININGKNVSTKQMVIIK